MSRSHRKNRSIRIREVRGNLYQEQLGEMSRHYDSMLTTMTTLWAAAIGGLFIYCIEHQILLLDLFGLFVTVCGMFFAYRFRTYRRALHDKMDKEMHEIYVPTKKTNAIITHWDAYLAIFSSLIIGWTILLIMHSCLCWPFWILWVLLGLAAECFILDMYLGERKPQKTI